MCSTSDFYLQWCALAPLQLSDLAALLELVKEEVVVRPQAKGEDVVQLKAT